MASAAALISTILPPMAAKARDIIKDKGLAIDRYIADKAMDNIEKDISRLQTTLYTIEGIVQVAEEKQIDEQGKPVIFIQNWLCDLVDIGYEARDVLDDFITFSSCIITAYEEASNPVNFISSFMLSYFGGLASDTSIIPLAILNRLEEDIRSVREKFDEKKKEGKNIKKEGSESVKNRRPKVGPSINKQSDYKFVEREEMKEGIMEKILQPKYDRVDVVAIGGMGGIGKTTLAQSIYNDKRVNDQKVPRSWLFVGENKFSAEKVIREIVNDQNATGIGNLQKKLKEKLRGDRFLIVLDDVWDVDGSEWSLLFNPLTEVGKGGLIIITSRGKEMCPELIKIQTAYNLEPISEEDSWSIFESYAFIDDEADSTPDLKRIGKEIVKKLNGLPLALKVVGRSLLNKDSSTWTNFLESNLTKDNEVMSALRWSYKLLPQHLKMCFTYCAFFPEDHVFDKKVLVEMWMAHDLIQKEEQQRPEDVGAYYFEQLVNASLFQFVDGKYVMHDLIHDLALLVSNGEFLNAKFSLPFDQMEKVRHINIDLWELRNYSRLRKIEKLLTLYITSEHKKWHYIMHDDIFKLKSIRVMVLRGVNIPDCIGELRHLRYLDVSRIRVKSLPDSLCRLYNLQMLAAPLDAALPRDIVNISSLRYVRANLSTCEGVGKLTSLQELSSISVCKGDNIRELGCMQKLRGKLTIKGLENVTSSEDVAGALMEKQTLIDQLKLVFNRGFAESTISKEVLDALRCPPNLTYLAIVGYYGLTPPSWMVDGKHKFEKLQTLELSNCRKLESLPSLGELTSLKHIFLRNVGVKRLGEEFYGNFTNSKVFFPSLESLSFDWMNEWEEWDDIIIENSNVSCFPCLTTLKIEFCAKLASLQLDALVSLKELKIRSCNNLVEITSAICLATTIERLQILECEHLQKMDFERLPSLKHLVVSWCNNLISIPRLVGIKYLSLDRCKSLRSLSIDIHELDSLEHLDITSCPTLELAFEDGSSSSSSSGNSIAVPLHNIRTDNTQVFRTLLHHELGSLESLDIRNLEGFENFDETMANNFCKSRLLKKFHIWHCEQLKSLPVDFHKLSSLESLNISNCPQLQSLPPDFHKLSSLKELTIQEYCPQLQSLPPDFHKLSSLEYLHIHSCPLSSLEYLHIHSCPQLQSLPPDSHKLSSLKILYIFSCPQLQSLPSYFHKLSSLKELIIQDCPQLQSLPPDFHKLSSLESLNINNCPQLQSLPPDFHKLSSLESLSINNCPQLQSLPPDFHKLSSLKSLIIQDCPQLQSLPPDLHKLSSLRYLQLIFCPQLKSLTLDFQKLSFVKRLKIRDCPLLGECYILRKYI